MTDHPLSLDKLTYINVGAEGTLRGKLHTTTSDIDAILEYVKFNARKVVLHFHGGLVNEEAGELTAKTFVPLYQRAGAHPVVFIWETGFLETIVHHLEDIQGRARFRKIIAYGVQQLGEHLKIPAFSPRPGLPEDINTIEARLFSPGGLQNYDSPELDAEVLYGLSVLDETLDEMKRQVKSEVAEQLQAALGQENEIAEVTTDAVAIEQTAVSISEVFYNVAQRYLHHRDHGFSATVVEETLREFYISELGAEVYREMKDVAQKMWASNDGLSGEQIHGGRYLLEGLFNLQQEKPTLIIDLVGHSLGSVAICMMLRTAEMSGLSFNIRNLILMAPACTSALFREEIVLRPDRYKQFRMFTMTDDFEKANHLLSIIYDRSLLYLVSGILEPDEVDMPLAGMMRFATCLKPFRTPELMEVHNFLFARGVTQRTVLACTVVTDPKAAAGFRSNAARHQDFNSDEDTKNSLVTMIEVP